MILLIIKNNFKVIAQKEFDTRDDAEKFLFDEHHDKSFDYELRDKKTDEILDEGYIESADEIEEIAMENMFPDEESMEGFDWTFE